MFLVIITKRLNSFKKIIIDIKCIRVKHGYMKKQREVENHLAQVSILLNNANFFCDKELLTNSDNKEKQHFLEY